MMKKRAAKTVERGREGQYVHILSRSSMAAEWIIWLEKWQEEDNGSEEGFGMKCSGMQRRLTETFRHDELCGSEIPLLDPKLGMKRYLQWRSLRSNTAERLASDKYDKQQVQSGRERGRFLCLSK